MAITWYGNQSTADSCNLGALAVVWPLLERMGVASIINAHLPTDPQAEYDHGSVLTLLMAARLYSPVALVNVPDWAAESGADILWDIPVEKLNDDRLGRSLDAFFTQRHSILASIALNVSREFGIPAVIGCSVATVQIKTGDQIRVNGSAGTVEILGYDFLFCREAQ